MNSSDLLRVLAIVEHVDDERQRNGREAGPESVVGRAFSALMGELGEFDEHEQAILDHYRAALEVSIRPRPSIRENEPGVTP